MTRLFRRLPLHYLRGKPRGWLLVIGARAIEGPRFWFGWTPEKGESDGWQWQPDGGWAWRRGAWEAGTESWGLIPFAAGGLAALIGLTAFLWRIL